MHLGGVARDAHQHRRHARPRRFRRRGRAHPQHGRWCAGTGRRRRGADAADQIRPRQGAAARTAPDRRDQQGRPARCPRRRGPQRDLRFVRGARRKRGATRFSDRFRLRPQWLGGERSRRSAPGPVAAVRADPGACAAAQGRSRCALRDAGDDPRLRPLSRPGTDRAHSFRRRPAQHAGQVAGPRRPCHRAGAADQIAGVPRARPAADRGSASRRHHRRRRARPDHRRRYDLRARGHRAASRRSDRPADPGDDLFGQRQPARRARGDQGDLADDRRASVPRGRGQCRDPGQRKRAEGRIRGRRPRRIAAWRVDRDDAARRLRTVDLAPAGVVQDRPGDPPAARADRGGRDRCRRGIRRRSSSTR